MKFKTSDSVNFDTLTCDRSPRRSFIRIILGICILSSALVGAGPEGGAQEGPVYVQSEATVSGLPAIAFTSSLGRVGYLEVASKPEDFDGWPPGKVTFVVFRPDGFPDGQRMVSSAYGTLHPELDPGPSYEVKTTMIADNGLLRSLHPLPGGNDRNWTFGAGGEVSTEHFWVVANVWEDDGTVHMVRMNSIGEVEGANRVDVNSNPQDHLFTRIGAGSDSDGNMVQPFGGQIAAVLVYNRHLPFGQGEQFGQVMNFLFNTYLTTQGGDPDAVPVTDGLVLHLNGSNAVMDHGAVTQFTDMSGRDNHAQVFSEEGPAQIEWIAEEDGMWNVPENWDPERVPLPFDEALFLNGGTMTVGDDWTVGAIDIAGGSHLIVEAGATLTTTGDYDSFNQTFRITTDGGGTLTLFGNVVAANHAKIGQGDIDDGDFATVEIDGGSFVAGNEIILTQFRSGAEITLRNEAFIQAGRLFAEWGPTQDFQFRLEEGTSIRQGDVSDGLQRFERWVNDGKVEFLGEDLVAYIRSEAIDGGNFAVLTAVRESDLPQVISWDNPGEGSWDVVDYWDPQVLPRDRDEAQIFNGGTVTVGNDWALGALDIRNGSSLIVEESANLTVGRSGSILNLKLGVGDNQLTVYGHVQAEEAEFGFGDVADGDVANVLIDGGSFVASGRIIVARVSSLAEFTLRNGALMEAGDWFAEWGPTQEFMFYMEEGTTLRRGNQAGSGPSEPPGVEQFESWIADGKVEAVGEDLVARVSLETVDGKEWAVLTIVSALDEETETFASWQNEYFTSEELDDEDIIGPGAAPAGDGVPNAVKFLMGLDPKVPSRDALPVESVQTVDDANYLTLTFTVMNDVAAEWGVQATGVLGDWPDSAVEVEELRSVDESAGTTTYTYRDVVPSDEADSRFLRMWVDVNE